MAKMRWEKADKLDTLNRPDTERFRISRWADKILGLKDPDSPQRTLRTGEVILPSKKKRRSV